MATSVRPGTSKGESFIGVVPSSDERVLAVEGLRHLLGQTTTRLRAASLQHGLE